MTRLLVSVRSAREAEAALRGGADLIDIKEPARGALGAADPSVWGAVAAVVKARVPLSAALGELLSPELPARLSCCRLLEAFSFAKAGLAGCADAADLRRRLTAMVATLPANVTAVAVAYADTHWAGSPPPMEVLELAVECGCGGLLLDTYDKTAAGLFDHMPLGAVRQLIDAARDAGLLSALAGSLRLDSVGKALACRPDVVAVRGAVCRGARTGPVDPSLVRRWAGLVAGRPDVVHAGAPQARHAVPGEVAERMIFEK